MFEVKLGKELFHGILSLYESADGVIPLRKSEKMLDFYRKKQQEAWVIRAYGAAGVKIAFRTAAKKLRMGVKMDMFSREYFGFDVTCSGKLVKRITQDSVAETFVLEADLPDDGVREVVIALPWQARCTVQSLLLDDISVVEPVIFAGKPLLLLGDSITQGFDVAAPGESYAAQVAAALGYDCINLAVGGAVMQGEDAEAALDYPWEKVILAFGVNDCSKRYPLDHFRRETIHTLTALTSRRDVEIAVIAPLPWRGCPADQPSELALENYRAVLRECVSNFPQARLIEGTELLDDDQAYFADGVHPNAAGMKMIAERLAVKLDSWRR